MYQTHVKFPQSQNSTADELPKKSVKSIAVFISPNIRNQNYPCSTPSPSEEVQEDSFDEIECLRAEVKRLSDIVSEQSDLISYIQKTFNQQKSKENNSSDRLDLLTELNQHKISMACLERENLSLISAIKQLQNEMGSLSATVGHQCNELVLLRNAIQDLFLGANTENCEINGASSQMRSVSCSELQANGVSYIHNNGGGGGGSGFTNGEDHQNGLHQIARSFNGSLPPSGNQQHHPIYQPNVSGQSQRKFSHSLKSASNGKLSNIVMLLKSPKVSLRRSSSRSNKYQQANTTLIEDEFSSTEHLSHFSNGRTPSLLLPTSTDFEEWSTDAVCDFLRQLGLDYCLAAARSWIKTGADLINANNVQIQQNLGPLKPLHLKKLLIHVSLRTTQDLMSTRETAFLPSINPHPDFNVCAWLEDIGLPMYKPNFEAELIDAYVLHELTLSELQSLGVDSELHMLSMRRGLQLLRQIDFDLSRLCRHSPKSPITNGSSSYHKSNNNVSSDDISPTFSEMPSVMTNSSHSTPGVRIRQSSSFKMASTIHRSASVSADTVCKENTPPKGEESSPSKSSSFSSTTPAQPSASPEFWTCYRLEVWLREIELPEYVSSLRNSGLHGALLVYEDRFTVDTLANLLEIGPNRTLLRRHLYKNFADLLGQSTWSRKQRSTSGAEANPSSAIILNPSSKLKLVDRRSSLKRIFAVSSAVGSNAVRYLASDLLCSLEADFDFKNSAVDETL
nr:hypothetical protein HmN_000120600 [Hymenolepis microstoma]